MIVQTKAELIEWLQRFPGYEPYATDDGFRFRSPEAQSFWVSLPKKPGRVVFLAHTLTLCHLEEYLWDGGYVWFTEWGVWGNQEIGYRMIERMRLGFGATKQFQDATVQQFRNDERLDAAGVLLLSMLFGWDTWYAPSFKAGVSDFVAFISHDEIVEITCRTREAFDAAFALFSNLKFEPKRSQE